MAEQNTGSPIVKFDAGAKSPTTVLLPLALALYISQSQPQPITIEWTQSLEHGVVLQPPQSGSQSVNGVEDVSKWLVNSYAHTGIGGTDQTQSSLVSSQIDRALKLPTLPFADAQKEADTIDDHLALRATVLGQTLTAADFALWAGIVGCSPFIGIIKKGTHVHLTRWFQHIDHLSKAAVDDLAAAKKVAKKDAAAAASADGPSSRQAKSFDIFLPSAKEGQVVTRFPPEPSGYLHLGHTKAAILNQYFAKTYKGRLIIRFDDTNPTKEKAEFQDAIIEDLALLGIKPDQTTFTSDYFDIIYQYVIRLIKQGDAYADDTLQEEMRAQRMDGLPSARRNMSVEETLSHFAEMCTGNPEGRVWCLRAKMSVDDPNKALRDPVIYRCNPDVVHHRTGTKYKVYPTYDFACPVVDSLEGVTHALRTNEYRDRNPQYAWFLQKLNIRNVEIWDFGRLNFQYTLLSKRKLTWFVENKKVTGWNDPRFPTVRGIRRRGMTIEALQQFILATGPSQQIINMEWDQIWSLNKKIIDPIVPRFHAVETVGRVKCTIAGAPPAHEKAVPKHKKNLDIGNKTTVYNPTIWIEQVDAQSFEDQEEVTIMDWGNVFVRSKQTDAQGTITSIEMDAHFDGDFKKTKKKIHWLADSETRPLVPVSLLDFDYLITKPKLEEDDKFEDFVTPVTEFTVDAVADANVTELATGERIQFERKGYYILDSIDSATGRRNFIKIPDGRMESVQSKYAPVVAEAETPAAAGKSKGKAAKGGAVTESPADVEAKKQKLQAEREAKKANKAKKDEEKAAKKAAAAAAAGGVAVGGAAAAAATTITTTGTAKTESKEFPELVNGGESINMYKMKRVAEDIPTPAKTSMYSVKPII